jgi:RNAse (barnase) inhibitor barstar
MVIRRRKGPPKGPKPKPQFTIDGIEFSTLDEFAKLFSSRILRIHEWHGNLDAFNDILRGGFGTPEEGFVLIWKNHKASRRRLGDKLFNTLVEIIRAHGLGGQEEEDGVELILA